MTHVRREFLLARRQGVVKQAVFFALFVLFTSLAVFHWFFDHHPLEYLPPLLLAATWGVTAVLTLRTNDRLIIDRDYLVWPSLGMRRRTDLSSSAEDEIRISPAHALRRSDFLEPAAFDEAKALLRETPPHRTSIRGSVLGPPLAFLGPLVALILIDFVSPFRVSITVVLQAGMLLSVLAPSLMSLRAVRDGEVMSKVD